MNDNILPIFLHEASKDRLFHDVPGTFSEQAADRQCDGCSEYVNKLTVIRRLTQP
ncbi:hypothetical protein [Paenibacillus ihbetae]|uniref:hypothetical protein n=1 Tax=Paenibacillus ihbetae TaxID=1870820 RepID=UPI001676E742|nr:hypothetical protein [Paenibacillus ihbetae]